jgi:protein-disulfide isomerase
MANPWSSARVLLVCFSVASGVRGGDSCLELDDRVRLSVTDYVRKLTRLPDRASVELARSSLATETCYRTLEFSVAGQPAPLVLFLSPDQRFLSTRVFDTRLDPEKAEAAATAQTAEKIQAYLAAHPRPALGGKDAAFTIVVFADFQCPFCRKTMLAITKGLAPSVLKDARVVFLNFPLPNHSWARQAADAAACLNGSPAFWKVHDFIFEHQSEMSAATVSARISDVAREAGVEDPTQFSTCVSSGAAASAVDEDFAFGNALGLTATPTLFVNGRQAIGAQSAEDIAALISGKHR